MEDFIQELQQEMCMLDDKESKEAIDLRKQLNVEDLDEKELLKFKVDFLAKHMGYDDLNSIEKNDYFKELIKGCIDVKKLQQYFDMSSISCIDKDSKMKFFYVLTDKNDESKTIYTFSDQEPITKISQEDVKKQFEDGMETLSKSRQHELKEILLGKKIEDKSKITMSKVVSNAIAQGISAETVDRSDKIEQCERDNKWKEKLNE